MEGGEQEDASVVVLWKNTQKTKKIVEKVMEKLLAAGRVHMT